jgi:ketosteroid isomerase-like protein
MSATAPYGAFWNNQPEIAGQPINGADYQSVLGVTASVLPDNVQVQQPVVGKDQATRGGPTGLIELRPPMRQWFRSCVSFGMMAVVIDRATLESELASFMGEYEQANNSHDIERVVPFIAEDATYSFSDGSYQGIGEISSAVEKTFATILNEVYEVRDLEWSVLTADVAVCRYRFAWTGVVGGEPRSGRGRGTNVIVRRTAGGKCCMSI